MKTVAASSASVVENPRQVLQCMEIWGGSNAADRSVSTPGLDIWVYSRPYQQAKDGGDVHYVSLCGGGVLTRFIVADVAGHGVAVSDLSRSLRDLMRRHINRKDQRLLARELNQQFGELSKLGRFATAVVGTYKADRDLLSICNAGHPRPLWYRAETRRWAFVDVAAGAAVDGLSNLPLGVDDSTAYPQTTLKLGKGDLVLCYTDALVEAFDSNGRPLGEEGLLDIVRSLDPTDPAGVERTLVERLDAFRGGRPAEDDLTFLLLHHNAGAPRPPSFARKLDVYAKVFGLRKV